MNVFAGTGIVAMVAESKTGKFLAYVRFRPNSNRGTWPAVWCSFDASCEPQARKRLRPNVRLWVRGSAFTGRDSFEVRLSVNLFGTFGEVTNRKKTRKPE